MERVATRAANARLWQLMQTHPDPQVRVRAAMSLLRAEPDSAPEVAREISAMLQYEQDSAMLLQLINALERARGAAPPPSRRHEPDGLVAHTRALLNLPLSELAWRASRSVGRLTLRQVGTALAAVSALYAIVTNLAGFGQWLSHVIAAMFK